MRRASRGEIRWESIPDRGRCKGPVAGLILAFQGAERKGFGLYCPWDGESLEGLRSRAGGRDGGRREMAVGLELREPLWFGEVGERRPGEGTRLWTECLGRGMEVCGNEMPGAGPSWKPSRSRGLGAAKAAVVQGEGTWEPRPSLGLERGRTWAVGFPT